MSHWIWPHLDAAHFFLFGVVAVAGVCCLVAAAGYPLGWGVLVRLGGAGLVFLGVSWLVMVVMMEVDRHGRSAGRNEYRGEGILLVAAIVGSVVAAVTLVVLLVQLFRREAGRGPPSNAWLWAGVGLLLVIPFTVGSAGWTRARDLRALPLRMLLRDLNTLGAGERKWKALVPRLGLDARTEWTQLVHDRYSRPDGHLGLQEKLADPDTRARLRSALDDPDPDVRHAAKVLLVIGVPELRVRFTNAVTAPEQGVREALDQ
ncbi:MAG: hypothetical protein HY904_20100 [Deltaproteobacteria bacterium]|nr:hypothetical protein [Deltaproteobacteria bacterium]